MVVGGDRPGEQGQAGVAVARLEVPEDLVVGPVFLDDVDDVPDVRPQEGHGLGGGRVGLGEEAVVLRHLAAQLAEHRRGWRRHGEEAGLFQLPDILVGPLALLPGQARIPAAVADIGTRVALAVHHIDLLAVAAHGHRRRIPARGNQADHLGPGGIVVIVGLDLPDRTGGPLRQPHHGDGVLATVADQQGPAVRRQGQGIGAGPAQLQGIGQERRRCRRGKGLDQTVRSGIEDRHPVGIVEGRIEATGLGMDHERIGLSGDPDPLLQPEMAVRPHGDGDQLPVSLAGDIGLGIADEGHAPGEGAPGPAVILGPVRAWPQVELRRHLAAGKLHQADTVVLQVGGQQPLAVRADRHARHLRLDLEAEPALVTQRDRRPGHHVVPVPGKHRHRVVHPAGGIEVLPVRGPGQADEGIGQAQCLQLAGLITGNVVQEHELAGARQDHLALVVPVPVEAAGEDRQRAAVRRDGETRGLTDHIVRQVGQVRVQGLEQGPRRGRGRDGGTGGHIGHRCGAGRQRQGQ